MPPLDQRVLSPLHHGRGHPLASGEGRPCDVARDQVLERFSRALALAGFLEARHGYYLPPYPIILRTAWPHMASTRADPGTHASRPGAPCLALLPAERCSPATGLALPRACVRPSPAGALPSVHHDRPVHRARRLGPLAL